MSAKPPDQASTPRADGFAMPAEWAPHQCCFMAWPTRRSLWGELSGQANRDYAEVARTVARFEPVLMICRPGDAADVRDHCGSAIEVAEIEIDDSWTRDNGPIFVTNDAGGVAIVDFGFNAWGGKYHPYGHDADLGRALAALLGIRRYQAQFVLEGGSIFVDGEGTLVTTEGPVLDPNRNPGATRERFEEVARTCLGADKVLWLVAFPDRDTDGHVDGVAQYARPGELVLLVPDDPEDANYGYARENLARLAGVTDARGRPLTVTPFEVTGATIAAGERVEVPYLNCYLANGGVVAPTGGAASRESDQAALARLREIFPDREVVGVPGAALSYGGGGPHCITQQMPLGLPVPG